MSMWQSKKIQGNLSLERPPEIVDVLHDILAKRKSIPGCMPQRPYDAAHWWIAHQEEPHAVRDVPWPMKKNGETVGWNTPYHDRLSYTLRVFLGLTEPQRVYVIAGIESGVPWRGDSITMHALIWEQHQEMQKDKNGYIENAKKVAKQAGVI